jgi:hypothetical protein
MKAKSGSRAGPLPAGRDSPAIGVAALADVGDASTAAASQVNVPVTAIQQVSDVKFALIRKPPLAQSVPDAKCLC